MGFIKRQQIKIAIRLLVWQYEKLGQPHPGYTVLEDHAKKLVNDAHRIAKERGGNVIEILKQMVVDIKNRR